MASQIRLFTHIWIQLKFHPHYRCVKFTRSDTRMMQLLTKRPIQQACVGYVHTGVRYTISMEHPSVGRASRNGAQFT